MSHSPTSVDTAQNGTAPVLEGTDYAANQIIVKLKPGIHTAAISTLKNELRASVEGTAEDLGFQLWNIKGMNVEEAIATYSHHPLVDYIQPNYTIKVNLAPSTPGSSLHPGDALSSHSLPTDPDFGELWGLNNSGQTGGTPDADIDAPEAWEYADGSGVVIGVIDTGVDYTHPDLINQMWTNAGETPGDGIDNDGNGFVDDYYGYDFANMDGDPFDDNSHGTHVAGTIAADGDNDEGIIGVAPNAKIMALKFLDASGSGSTFAAIEAINYAVLMGADLTNNSWGGGGFSQALMDAIAAAEAAGQLFIAAAGNDSVNNDLTPSYPSNYDLDNIIAVASTTDTDGLSFFSNYGATTVDLSAPGSDIYSTVPGGGYNTYSGTSMATPHVSGVAALLLSQNPDLTPAQVKALILGTVDPIAALDGKTVTGGRLNAFKAVFSEFAATISGTKWHDIDADGIQDATEPGLKNWTIYLDANNNGQLDGGELSTLTNENGAYSFSLLTAGTYSVAEVLKPGWGQNFPGGTGTHTVTVAEGETASNINFGNIVTNPGEIRGSKWHDQDRNGVWDIGEAALAGWTIYLDQNTNGQLDIGEASTITNANGEYAFTGLAPGSYTLAAAAQPGWIQTFPVLGATADLFYADFSDSQGNGSTDGFTIDNTGATVAGLWHLSTGRGNQPGHSVEDSLYFGQGEGPNGGGNYDVGHTAGRVTSPTIDLSTVSTAELSFNYFLGTEKSSSYDRARVLISVDGGAFTSIASNPTTLTDPTTGWTKATLDLTDYVGKQIQLQFDFNTVDSYFNTYEGWYIDDILVNGTTTGTQMLEIEPDEIMIGVNFGSDDLTRPTIAGHQWNDQNGNGTWESGESALAGWTVYLDNNQNSQLDAGEQSTVTDSSGEYIFTHLEPGTYQVAEVVQSGWEKTFPSENSHQVTVDYEDEVTGIDFGNQQIAPPPPPGPVFGTPAADELLILQGATTVFAGGGDDWVDASQSPGGNYLYGGSGNDVILASVADRVFAGKGDDILYAGEGLNRMHGGQGADQFWITLADLPVNPHIITDFQSGSDRIGIGGLGIDFSELTLSQVGTDTRIAAFGTNLAVLKNIQVASLASSDFVFA